MLVLAIWLFLIGYTVAITGKRNLGVSYAPQTDGSIKAVDDKGNPARTVSLLEVVSCAGPTPAATGAPVPAGAIAGRSTSSSLTGPKVQNPIVRGPAGLPLPNLVPATQPAPALRQQLRQIRPPNQPSGPGDLVDQAGRFLTNLWNGIRSL